MKKTFYLLLLLGSILYSQDKNKHLLDQKSGREMLIGLCDRSAFADTNYSWWFNSGFENYAVDSLIVAKLKTMINSIDITIIMGSWCSDSKREVPRFYKIMSIAGYDENKIKLICVDEDKKTTSENVDQLDIKLVPTFILYKEGKEIGRIVETPKRKLEEDIEEIVFGM